MSGAPARGTVSARAITWIACAISGARTQKLRLTRRLSPLSRFGTVSNVAYQQGLVAPFIVELFTVRVCIGGSPGIVVEHSKERPLPGRKRHRLRAPDAGDTLKEPDEDINPGSHLMALVPTPWGDLLAKLRAHPL